MKLVDWLLVLLVGFAGGVVGFVVASNWAMPNVNLPALPVPVAVEAEQPPGSIVKLVATTPDGTRVYRIEGPDMIIPAVLAVSPNGQVAFR